MRLNWKIHSLAMIVALALAGAGCSGINSSQSVSPMDFLMPGIGHFLKIEPASTNAPSLLIKNSPELATVR